MLSPCSSIRLCQVSDSSSWVYLREEVPSGGYACKAATNHGKALGACGAASVHCGQQKVPERAALFSSPPAWQVVTCHSLLDCPVPGTA